MSQLEPDEGLMRSALEIANAGMAVFPLLPRTAVPLRGLINWERLATRDPEQVHRWWGLAPFNIGVATGGVSSVLVVDLYAPTTIGLPHGRQILAELACSRGESLPVGTRTVNTPGGGQHLYFRVDDNAELPNTAGYLGPRIDTRGHRGYVVGPGSIVPEGRYELVDTTAPIPLPGWIGSWLGSRARAPQLSAGAAVAGLLSAAASRTPAARASDPAGQPGRPNPPARTAARTLGGSR